MKNLVRFLLIILCFFTCSKTTYATEFRTGDSLLVSEETIIDGNLFISGNDIVIQTEVTGDIVCAGKNITISGSVGGDVLCVGQAITVSGDVAGSVRTASQNLSINGSVNKNVTSLGQNIGISSGVGGDVFVGAAQFISNADIAGSIFAGVETLEINGTVEKDVKATVTSLTLGSSASISGELNYESEKDAQIAVGATIGKVIHRAPVVDAKKETSENKKDVMVSGAKKVGEIIWSFVVYLGIGILFIVLFPHFAKRIRDEMETRTGISIAIGFLAIFSIPLVILFFTVTIIGIPVAILAGLAFALALLVSRLSIAFVLGRKVLDALKAKNAENTFVQILVGTILIGIVFSVPFLGGMLEFFGCVWALGAVVRILTTRNK